MFKRSFLAATHCFIKLFQIFKVSYILYDETTPVILYDQKKVVSFKLFTGPKKNHTCLTDSQYSRCYWKITLAYRLAKCMALWYHGFFSWLILLVSSPPSTTTLGLPHSSLMSTNLSKFSKALVYNVIFIHTI